MVNPFPRTEPASGLGLCWQVGRCLVKIKRDLENQVRGLLKDLGLVVSASSPVPKPRASWHQSAQTRLYNSFRYC